MSDEAEMAVGLFEIAHEIRQAPREQQQHMWRYVVSSAYRDLRQRAAAQEVATRLALEIGEQVLAMMAQEGTA
jgi:hypothetical protein